MPEQQELAADLAQLLRCNRSLVVERNEAAAELKQAQHKLRECNVLMSILTKRLGGDVFIAMHDAAKMRDRLHVKQTKQGVRLRLQERGRHGAR